MTTGEQPVRDEDEYQLLAGEALLFNSDIQAARRTFQDLQIQLADLNRRKRDLAVAAFSSSHQPTMDRHADVVKDIKEAHQAQARALERRDGGVEDALKHS